VSTVNPIELTAEIVSAFVSNNSVPPGELSALMQTVHAAVTRLADGGESSAPPPVEAQTPAVSIRKSVTPDYLICLDDGKKFKSLKRSLAKIGLTSDQYRVKWNLPYDYPMVAPNYAVQRSELAKKIGLGQKKPVVPKSDPSPSVRKRKARRSRKTAAESIAS
jgi:predicted transcriptional regulator